MEPDDQEHPLRLLLLEDNEADAELLIAHLEAQGVQTQTVWASSRSEYTAALKSASFDLICSDYSLPGFDGLTALEMARSQCPEVPFIFVSGKLGEEFAIGTLRDGATDYVLKRRLSRFVPAVRRAVAEAAEKRAHASAQAEILRQKKVIDEALRIGRFGVWHWNLESGRVWASAGLGEIVGIEAGEVAGERVLRLLQMVTPEDRPALESAVTQALETGVRQTVSFGLQAASGPRTLSVTFQPSHDSGGQARELIGTLEYAGVERRLRNQTTELDDAFGWFLSWAPVAVVVTNAEGAVLMANPRLLELTGRAPEEVVGQPVSTLLGPIPQHDEEFSCALRPADGSGLPCKVTVRGLSLGDQSRVKVWACVPEADANSKPLDLNEAAAEIYKLSNVLQSACENGESDKLTVVRRSAASLSVICRLFDVAETTAPPVDLNVVVESAVAILARSQTNLVIVPLLIQQPLPIHANPGPILRFLCQVARESAKWVSHQGSCVWQTCLVEDGSKGECALLSIEIRGSGIEAERVRELAAGCALDAEVISNPPLGVTVQTLWPVGALALDA